MGRTSDVNTLSLIKDKERYIFLYPPGLPSLKLLLKTLYEFAADTELSFTEANAKALANKACEIHEKDRKKGSDT